MLPPWLDEAINNPPGRQKLEDDWNQPRPAADGDVMKSQQEGPDGPNRPLNTSISQGGPSLGIERLTPTDDETRHGIEPVS